MVNEASKIGPNPLRKFVIQSHYTFPHLLRYIYLQQCGYFFLQKCCTVINYTDASRTM
jgi:prophage antirepressor-like protein